MTNTLVRLHGPLAALALAAIPAAFGVVSLAAAKDVQRQAQTVAAIHATPEVFLLRGFADIFSDGLNKMGAALEASGIRAHVQGHATWRSVANRIIADREEYGPSPVVLVGHSLGGNAVIRIAEELNERGIAVDQLITLAATDPEPVPANVRRATNYYFETNGWGRRLVPGQGFSGALVNKDYSDASDIGHFNIDKQRSVQAEILSLIASAAR